MTIEQVLNMELVHCGLSREMAKAVLNYFSTETTWLVDENVKITDEVSSDTGEGLTRNLIWSAKKVAVEYLRANDPENRAIPFLIDTNVAVAKPSHIHRRKRK